MGDADQDMANKEEDLGKVKKILTSVYPWVDLSKLDLLRLWVKRAGVLRKDRTSPRRPFRITLDSPDCKDIILRNTKALKNNQISETWSLS